MHDSQIKWKCRKGLRELDILLSKYFEENYSSLSNKDKILFIEFIELDTYEILDMLTCKEPINTKFKNIIFNLKSLN